MTSAASPGFGASEARNEVSTAKTETTGRLMRGQSSHGPYTFLIILERNLHGYFTKIHLISKFNLPFCRTKLEKLCFIVTLPHNKFAIFLYTGLQNLTLTYTKIHQLPTPSLDRCWGFIPGPTGDFRTPNPMRLPHSFKS